MVEIVFEESYCKIVPIVCVFIRLKGTIYAVFIFGMLQEEYCAN